MPSPKVRKYVYRVATAALGVAAAVGVLSGEAVAALLVLAAAVTGMADANTTSTTSDDA